ncbi:hypothetical protein FRC12_018747 [Ceratobasidium sp. 428]|nr:hypothetical protein FRC12_018747 [Ceratobasidium sp. 428]
MLCKTSRSGCATIDMEHEGTILARYLGHGGTITDFSVSGGDPQVFATSCSDGFARLFDSRTPLPVLTFDACQNTECCYAVILAHPDSIPTLFTGTGVGQQIKVWDVRARTPVYELATGNNRVQSLAWDPMRNHLYAATECSYQDWMGYRHDYRYTESGKRWTPESEDRRPKSWPENAWHLENHFDYMFDAGDHRIYRYAYKEDPDVSVLPKYGDAQPGECDDFW